MPGDEYQQLHALIEGRVQGVGFRYFVYDQALLLGVAGWVRNLTDGRVEVLAEGKRSTLDQFLAVLRRGSRSSLVLGLQPTWKQATHEYADFQILPTTL